jgi:hypothetical protein
LTWEETLLSIIMIQHQLIKDREEQLNQRHHNTISPTIIHNDNL